MCMIIQLNGPEWDGAWGQGNEFPCDVIVFYGADNKPDNELFIKSLL